MWVGVHAVSGAALAAVLPGGAVVSAPAAVALHALLDLAPHWDYTRSRRRYVWGAADLAASAALVGGLALSAAPTELAVAAVLSAAPDLDSLHVLVPSIGRRAWFPSHWRRFPHGSCRPLCGVGLQAVVVVLSAGILALRL
jgi:hypothetical protein